MFKPTLPSLYRKFFMLAVLIGCLITVSFSDNKATMAATCGPVCNDACQDAYRQCYFSCADWTCIYFCDQQLDMCSEGCRC